MLNENTILTMNIDDIVRELAAHYSIHVPGKVETPDEMSEASKLYAEYVNGHIFLQQLLIKIDIHKRTLKFQRVDKRIIDEVIAKEGVIAAYDEMLKSASNAISRLVTMNQLRSEELRLADGKYWKDQ